MKFFNWIHFDNQQMTALKQPEAPLALKCPNCTNEYFEKVTLARYSANHSIIPGQNLSEMSPGNFILLRCFNCQAIIEPKTILSANDPTVKPYQAFIAGLMKNKVGDAV